MMDKATVPKIVKNVLLKLEALYVYMYIWYVQPTFSHMHLILPAE